MTQDAPPDLARLETILETGAGGLNAVRAHLDRGTSNLPGYLCRKGQVGCPIDRINPEAFPAHELASLVALMTVHQTHFPDLSTLYALTSQAVRAGCASLLQAIRDIPDVNDDVILETIARRSLLEITSPLDDDLVSTLFATLNPTRPSKAWIDFASSAILRRQARTLALLFQSEWDIRPILARSVGQRSDSNWVWRLHLRLQGSSHQTMRLMHGLPRREVLLAMPYREIITLLAPKTRN